MPNIAAVLKQEITRLARREARSLTKSLQKASSQFRRDIAELKRQNSKALAEISRLQRSNGGVLPVKADGVDTANFRFSIRSLKSQRRRLGVSAADYARLIGVSAATVYSWEHGSSKPRATQLAALGAIRGLGKREVKTRLEQTKGKSKNGK